MWVSSILEMNTNEGERRSILVGESSSQDEGVLQRREESSRLDDRDLKLGKGRLRGMNVGSLSPLLPDPAAPGKEGPDETGGGCLATRGASGSMGMADEAPAPSPTLSLISTQPSRNLGGCPRATCLIKAESIEGIFHNEIVWAAEAAALSPCCTLPSGWKGLVCLSSTHPSC